MRSLARDILSKTQQEVLDEIKKPDVVLHYMKYAGNFNPSAYWFISGSMKYVRCSTVDRLYKLGLIVITKDSLGYPDIAEYKKR